MPISRCPRRNSPARARRSRWRASAEPVLARDGIPSTYSIHRWCAFDGQYFNLYSAYDGQTWHTGSRDLRRRRALGRTRARAVAFGMGRNLHRRERIGAGRGQSKFCTGIEAGDPFRIALARSTDGVHWTKDPKPVLPVGPRGSFDERGVADPYVIRAGPPFLSFLHGTRSRAAAAAGHRAIDRRRALGKTALESGSGTGRARRVRRNRTGRACGVVLRRLVVDAVHRPRIAASSGGSAWRNLPTAFTGSATGVSRRSRAASRGTARWFAIPRSRSRRTAFACGSEAEIVPAPIKTSMDRSVWDSWLAAAKGFLARFRSFYKICALWGRPSHFVACRGDVAGHSNRWPAPRWLSHRAAAPSHKP